MDVWTAIGIQVAPDQQAVIRSFGTYWNNKKGKFHGEFTDRPVHREEMVQMDVNFLHAAYSAVHARCHHGQMDGSCQRLTCRRRRLARPRLPSAS